MWLFCRGHGGCWSARPSPGALDLDLELVTGNSSIESLAYYRIPSYWDRQETAPIRTQTLSGMRDPLQFSAEEAVPLPMMTVSRSSPALAQCRGRPAFLCQSS